MSSKSKKSYDYVDIIIDEFSQEISLLQNQVAQLTQLVNDRKELTEDIEGIKNFLLSSDKKELLVDYGKCNQHLSIRKSNISLPTDKEEESRLIVQEIIRQINETNYRQQEDLKATVRQLEDLVYNQAREIQVLKRNLDPKYSPLLAPQSVKQSKRSLISQPNSFSLLYVLGATACILVVLLIFASLIS